MDEHEAEMVAKALGGQAWNSGGNIWLVRFERSDGKLIVLSDEVICQYENEDDLNNCRVGASIILH